MKHTKTRADKIVFGFQLVILVGFVLMVAGIIALITNLLLVSQELQDIPSASIIISIVAIPVFLTILGIFNYVFWGLLLNQEE